MNKAYHSIWNTSLGAWVAVSEISKSRLKSKSSVALAIFLLGLSNSVLSLDINNNMDVDGMYPSSNPPSPWSINDTVNIGSILNAHLTIKNGGNFSSLSGVIGENKNVIGGVTVQGPGSKWTVNGGLEIGQSGEGSLLITDGGVVTSTTGSVGDASDGNGEVTVDGHNSLWENNGDLIIGAMGNGIMTIQNGGLVKSKGDSYISAEPSSNQAAEGTVVIKGFSGSNIQSTWNAQAVFIGGDRKGSLLVEAGGKFTAADVYIGWEPDLGSPIPTPPSVVNIKGQGSQFLSDGIVFVGAFSNGQLTIENRAEFHSQAIETGAVSGVQADIFVKDPGTLFKVKSLLLGSNALTGNPAKSLTNFTISNGAEVQCDKNCRVASDDGTTAKLNISGQGSHFQVLNNDIAEPLLIGNNGEGSVLVDLGGKMTSQSGTYIGSDYNGTGIVSIKDKDSTWTSKGNIVVGYENIGSLSVSNAGSVIAPFIILADDQDADGTLSLKGSNSQGRGAITVGSRMITHALDE